MFELNDKLEVKVAKEIGPNKKSVVLIDNFYKDPDSIRELCFNTETNDDPDLIGSLSVKTQFPYRIRFNRKSSWS